MLKGRKQYLSKWIPFQSSIAVLKEKLFQIQMGTHKLFAYRWAYAPLACLPPAQKRGFNFKISIAYHTAIFSLFLSGCPQSFSRQLNITLIVKLLSNGLCTIVERRYSPRRRRLLVRKIHRTWPKRFRTLYGTLLNFIAAISINPFDWLYDETF